MADGSALPEPKTALEVANEALAERFPATLRDSATRDDVARHVLAAVYPIIRSQVLEEAAQKLDRAGGITLSSVTSKSFVYAAEMVRGLAEVTL